MHVVVCSATRPAGPPIVEPTRIRDEFGVLTIGADGRWCFRQHQARPGGVAMRDYPVRMLDGTLAVVSVPVGTPDGSTSGDRWPAHVRSRAG